MDTFFNEGEIGGTVSQRKSIPLANILEDDDQFKIELAAPGFSKEDFKINVEGLTLSISTEKENRDETKFILKEFGFEAFTRSFRLAKSIDTDKIEASYDAGLLVLTLQKKEEAKPKEPRLINVG